MCTTSSNIYLAELIIQTCVAIEGYLPIPICSLHQV